MIGVMTSDIEETLCLPSGADSNVQCETSSVKKRPSDPGCTTNYDDAGNGWKKDEVELHYRIEETPPLHFTILFALQVCPLLVTLK